MHPCCSGPVTEVPGEEGETRSAVRAVLIAYSGIALSCTTYVLELVVREGSMPYWLVGTRLRTAVLCCCTRDLSPCGQIWNLPHDTMKVALLCFSAADCRASWRVRFTVKWTGDITFYTQAWHLGLIGFQEAGTSHFFVWSLSLAIIGSVHDFPLFYTFQSLASSSIWGSSTISGKNNKTWWFCHGQSLFKIQNLTTEQGG